MLGRQNQANMSDKLNKNLWGGRFEGEADPGFAEFNRSFGFDRRLFEFDVRASIAHCGGLAAAGGLTANESKKKPAAPNNTFETREIQCGLFDEMSAQEVDSFRSQGLRIRSIAKL